MKQSVIVIMRPDDGLVSVIPPKTLPVTRLVTDQSPSSVAKTLALLFPVCKGAHTIAFLTALETHNATVISDREYCIRQRILVAETLHESLWLLLVEIPKVIAIEGQAVWFFDISRRMRQWINLAQHHILNTDHTEPNSLVREWFFLRKELLELLSTKLLGGQNSYIECLTHALVEYDWSNSDELASDYKSGILVSRLQLVWQSFIDILSGIQEPGFGAKKDSNDGSIQSWVSNARGLLKYQITFSKEHSRISALNILSPTAQHFETDGALQQILTDMLHRTSELWEKRAELLIQLYNPCCEYRIHHNYRDANYA